MHLARLAHKGTILGYREWAVLEGMRLGVETKGAFWSNPKENGKGTPNLQALWMKWQWKSQDILVRR